MSPNRAIPLSTAGAVTGGGDPRPLWDTWFVWPGFYRSEQAAFYPIEYRHYSEYLATSRHQGRYASLLEYSDSPMPVADDHVIKHVNPDQLPGPDEVARDLDVGF